MKLAFKQKQTEIITDCMDLTIRGFMRCVFHAEYTRLIKIGKPTEEQLKSAWDTIYEQYAVLVNNTQYMRMLDAMRKYIAITGKLMVAESALTVLSIGYDRESVNNLKRIGYNLNFDISKKEQYIVNINRLISNCKTLKAKAEVQLIEIDKIRKESGKEKQATEADFLAGIGISSKYMGFRIDVNACSIAEYADYQRQYGKYIERMEAKKQ